jgi:Fe(3+) dicitrate transport protein
MREEAGTGEPDRYLKVPSHTVIDVVASWSPQPMRKFYFKALNVLDEEYLVSHRPFGARPGAPLQLQVGFEIGF